MAEKTITLAMKFLATVDLLEGREPQAIPGFTVADAKEFLLDREAKTHSKSKSTTKAAPKPEDVELDKAILSFLAENRMAYAAKAVGEAMGVSSQKASARLRGLVKQGLVIKIEGERKGASAYVIA